MSERTCSIEGCEERAPHSLGWYIVGPGRRVRVWACGEHFLAAEKVNVELPKPAWLVQVEEAERKHLEGVNNAVQVIYADQRSVRTMEASGHGKPYHRGRVESWRYEGGKRYVL